MKNLFILLFLGLLIWGGFKVFKNDIYTGFYYPDPNNLTFDIQSAEDFSSLDECRGWVDIQVSKYNSDDTNYDYECGKNCKLVGEKPYICEDTMN